MRARSWAGAAGLLGATALGAAAYGVVAPGSQLFGEVLTAPRRPGEIALTYDDGPNPAVTPWLLDVLAARGVRATFFLIGRWALAQPVLVRRMVAEGHAVGNHTMTHPKLPLCSAARVREEIAGAQRAIEEVSGARVRLFRPPHGFRTPGVLRLARELGLRTTTWTTIANDWLLHDPEAIAARVEKGLAASARRRTAANVAMHDGSQGTPTADRAATVRATERLLGRAGAARWVTIEDWL